MQFGYGKEGSEKLEELLGDMNRTANWLGVLAVWMIICAIQLLIILLNPAEIYIETVLFALLPFAIYAIWAVRARKNVGKKIAYYENLLQQEEEERVERLENGRKSVGWRCPQCGKINNATDVFCAECKTSQF